MSIHFDESPTLYWLIGYALAILLAVGWWKLPQKNKSWILFFGGMALLLWMRLPVLVFNQEIDPDESQMLAHALTLRYDPIYWKFVDGQTIGPLDSYFLLLPSWFGFDLDYTSARIMGMVCILGSLFFFYRSARLLIGQETAWGGILPVLIFLTFIQEGDFVHYSSEQLALLFLNIALWLYLRQAERPQIKDWFLIGFFLGLLPFCKLQSVPLGLVLGLFALYKCFYVHRNRWGSVLALIGGGVAFPLVVLAWVFHYELWDDFWTFYIQGNLVYAGGLGFWENVQNALGFVKASPGFTLYCISLIPILVMGIRNFTFGSNALLAIFWVFVALYSILKTGNIFPHYLHFLLYPLLFLALVLSQTSSFKTKRLVGLWISLLWGGWLLYQKWDNQPWNRYVSSETSVPMSRVSQLILQHASPPDRMTIWGWRSKYHVETQLPQGAAEAHTERCIYDHPLRKQYYHRYLKDLREKQPKIFIDAVGPQSLWVQDRATQGHEVYPELKSWVETHYQFVGEVDFTRVYVRR